jgi:hypothetical protein
VLDDLAWRGAGVLEHRLLVRTGPASQAFEDRGDGGLGRTLAIGVLDANKELPVWRAYNQLNSAVRAPPICRKPVGEGAKRVTTPGREGVRQNQC